jgi:hypothetical protein
MSGDARQRLGHSGRWPWALLELLLRDLATRQLVNAMSTNVAGQGATGYHERPAQWPESPVIMDVPVCASTA